MLWKFYETDPEVCSYLFGTMHMSTKEAYTFVEKARKYIQTVSTYAAEMDLNASQSSDIIRYFLLPEGEVFSGFLDLSNTKNIRRSFIVPLKWTFKTLKIILLFLSITY
ncbi:MAG: TraB/GumN family protein [Saprospiraceae bacterium]|nr:TraB/GumN family protein [Saprospiraceae bacterium]